VAGAVLIMAPAADLQPVTLYTDGGCDPNPGPGGWGVVMVFGSQTHELSGREADTTNNRMELTAAIRGLEALKRRCEVRVYTDSQYLRQGITSWVRGWQRNGWRTRNGRPVVNQDLWQQLLTLSTRHEISWHWIRGHQGHPLNERADALATAARAQHRLPVHLQPASTGSDLPDCTLYCRGSCQGNPGPGGYASVVVSATLGRSVQTGSWPNTTNNLMELWAVIAGLRTLKHPSRVTICSSSRYVLDGATRHLATWERSAWRTRQGQVQHAELWQELARVMGDHDITWQHISATTAHTEMRAALQAARLAAQQSSRKDNG